MTKKLSLAEWLALLEKRHPSEIDLGLTRAAEVAGRLPISSPAKKVITVAGTNGKGSCVAVLEQLLCEAGLSVGTYTSPHLIRYNERIHINGREASDAAICQAFEKIEQARGNTSLTYFEFGTLAALLIMREAAVDVAVLEVGLGGRLDAVNIVDPDVAIVTSIALDHQDWLGSDLNVIAAEKAAIARRGKPLLYGAVTPMPGIVDTAATIGANLQCCGRDFFFSLPPELTLPPASVQCALQAIKLLNPRLGAEQNLARLGGIAVPGRFQILMHRGIEVILDVAHNPAAAERLAEQLSKRAPNCIRAVVGVMADKDIEGVIKPLNELVDNWYPVRIPLQKRAADADLWRQIMYNTPVYESVEAGFHKAVQDSSPGDTVVVFGSFFTVAPVLQLLDEKGMAE